MSGRLGQVGAAALCALASGRAAADPLQDLLDAAQTGATVTIPAGTHSIEEPLRIRKPLVVEGNGNAVIDAGHRGELMIVESAAAGSSVRGLAFRNGGRSSTREWAGVRVEGAGRVRIEGNAFIDCNYGIYLAKARDCEVRGNVVEGVPGMEQNSGNGIHLWDSDGAVLSGNRVTGHRDGVYLEFADATEVEGNAVEENMRYGLHFMFSNDCRYRGNRFVSNGAGVAVMYSDGVEMTGNLFERNWGGSSYGLLLKDIRDSVISGNTFLANSTGVYFQGVNRTRFEDNALRENGWALRLLSDGSDNDVLRNDFVRNSFDLAVNGSLATHRFADNYWDRYEGYDLRRDGTGDVPYRPVSLYGTLTERVPASLLLLHSFLVQLLDRAERAFPSVSPESAVDPAPAMKPRRRPALPTSTKTTHENTPP